MTLIFKLKILDIQVDSEHHQLLNGIEKNWAYKTIPNECAYLNWINFWWS